MRVRSMVLAVVLWSTAACSTQPPGTVITGEVWTGEAGASTVAGSIIASPGRIEVIPGTRAGALSVDRITPGLVDAHAHPAGLGRKLSELDLQDLPSLVATLEGIGRAAAQGDGWLTGRGWDQNDWSDAPEGGWPTATHLDTVTPSRPTALRRVDGHAVWVNSAALRLARIDRDTPDPPGGTILRDPTGAPTGVLLDAAMALVPTPAPTADQVATWLRRAQEEMTNVGLVGAHDMGVDDTTLAAYRQLNREGALHVRIWAYLTPDSAAAEHLLAHGPVDEGRLRIVGIKAFADGALGSRGAHLMAPYADAPDTRGLEITHAEALNHLAARCLKARVQLAVHAIGDAGARTTLDAFAAARQAVPDASHIPLRLEHAQVVAATDRARLASLRVTASVQPTHATSDHPWAEDRLGPERVGDSYAWRALIDAGAEIALGSDFPVEHPEVAWGLWAATTRTDRDGRPAGGWRSDQALTEAEALAGFTVGAGRVVLETPPRCLGAGCQPDATLWRRLPGPPGWEAVGVVIDGEPRFRQ